MKKTKQKHFSKNVFYFTLLLLSPLIFSVTTEAKEPSATPAYRLPEDIVARVNDLTIYRKNVAVAVNNIMPLVSYHKSVTDRRRRKIRNTALDNLILDHLIYQEAKRRKIKASKTEINAKLTNFRKRIPRGMTLRKILKNSDMTKEDLKNDFKKEIQILKLRTIVNKELSAKAETNTTETRLRKFYDDNLKQFKEPEKIHLSEILFKTDPSTTTKSWLEIRNKLLVIEKTIRDGADFAEVARDVSQDPYASEGGDMGWVHSGSLTPALEKAAKQLKVGQMSSPVESLYGYHLIKLHEIKPASLKKFEDLNQKRLKARVIKIEYKDLRAKWAESLRSKANIEYIGEEYEDLKKRHEQNANKKASEKKQTNDTSK